MGPRIAAGLIGLAIVLPLIIYGGLYAITALVGLVLLIAIDEYVSMAMPEQKLRGRLLLHPLGLLTFLGLVYAPPAATIPIISISGLILMIVPMLLDADVASAAKQVISLGFGLLYMPVAMATMLWIRQEPDGLALVFLLLTTTWLGDTGAYFAGRAFGKTPLIPRVSPKKTVEGFLGGVVLSVAGAAVVKIVGGLSFSWPALLLLAAALDLAGVVGDLVESMLKRAFGVKDSGWIMPGHGGILDRIDSLLFSSPLLWAVVVARSLYLGAK